eukprot:30154-Pelagococcus_subviridis.AAC.10
MNAYKTDDNRLSSTLSRFRECENPAWTCSSSLLRMNALNPMFAFQPVVRDGRSKHEHEADDPSRDRVRGLAERERALAVRRDVRAAPVNLHDLREHGHEHREQRLRHDLRKHGAARTGVELFAVALARAAVRVHGRHRIQGQEHGLGARARSRGVASEARLRRDRVGSRPRARLRRAPRLCVRVRVVRVPRRCRRDVALGVVPLERGLHDFQERGAVRARARVRSEAGVLRRGGGGVFVHLQVLPVNPQPDAAEVVARLLPVERILNELPHLVDAVEPDRDDRARQPRDPSERRREHERRAEHEEEQDELQHVQIRERNRRGDDPLHGFVRSEAQLELLVNLERGALAYVPQPPVRLDDHLHAHRDPVAAVRRHHREQRLRLPRLEQVRQRRLPGRIRHHALLVRHRLAVFPADAQVAQDVSHRRVQDVGQAEELGAVFFDSPRGGGVLLVAGPPDASERAVELARGLLPRLVRAQVVHEAHVQVPQPGVQVT